MKKLKKLLSIVLAVAMVMSLAVSVTADDYTITIKNAASGYTYTAYQIFDGNYSNETLSNITWGADVNTDNESAIYTALAAVSITYQGDTVYPFTSDHTSGGSALTSAEDVAKALATYNSSTEIANAFAKVMKNYLKTSSGTPLSQNSGNNNYYEATVDAGYYLIIDSTDLNGKTDANSAYIVQVVGTTEIDPKSSVPSLVKTVTDVNDSDSITSTGNSADYDVGDDVPFTLTATIDDEYYEKYSTYKLVFSDTLSNGLTLNTDSIEVKVGSSVIDSDCYTVAYTYTQATGVTSDNFSDGVYYSDQSGSVATEYNSTLYVLSGLTITISDTNSLESSDSPVTVGNSSAITVTYTALLNSNADYQENNSAKITYSNDPNSNSEGVSQTSLTYVYDYSLTITKTDGTYALDGAGFTLYKKVILANASDADASTTYYANAGDTTGTLGSALTSGGTYYVAYTATVTGSNGTTASGGSASADTFTFSGLDDGEYVLVESKTPSGYNTMENVTFYIIAKHDGSTLTSLIAGSASNATSNMTNWNASTSGTDIGSITATIENNAGSNLPETGGIGVTIFYVVGGILILAAAGVIVISRKKTKAEK